MYDTMRQNFCWRSTANDVYAEVRDCRLCAGISQTNDKQRDLRLFPPSGPLEYVVMDIFCPLPKKFGNQIIVVLMDRYSKLWQTILTAQTTPAAVTLIFVDYWMFYSGIPSKILTANGLELV